MQDGSIRRTVSVLYGYVPPQGKRVAGEKRPITDFLTSSKDGKHEEQIQKLLFVQTVVSISKRAFLWLLRHTILI